MEDTLESEGLVLTGSQLKMLMDLPTANLFSVDRDFRYTFFTAAHARMIRDIWSVELSVGMDALADVMRDNHDRTKANNCLYWAMNDHEFKVTEAFGLPTKRRVYESLYRPNYNEGVKLLV